MVSRTCDDAYFAALQYRHKVGRGHEDADYGDTMMAANAPRSSRHMRQMAGERSSSYRHQKSQYNKRQSYEASRTASLPRLYPSAMSSPSEWRQEQDQHYHHHHAGCEETSVPSFYGEVEADQYYSRHPHPWSQSRRSDYHEYGDQQHYQDAREDYLRRLREREEQQHRWNELRYAEEEEELRRYQEEHRARKEQEAAAARKAEEERKAAEEEQLLQQKKAEEQRELQKKKLAELMCPSGIPKPPPPPPEFHHLHCNSHPHWGTGVAAVAAAAAASKNAAANANASPSSTIEEKEVSTLTEASDHCSEISKVDWDPPYLFSSSEHSSKRNKPLHLCKSDDEWDKKCSAHSSVSRKLQPSSLKSLSGGSASEISIFSYHSRVGSGGKKMTSDDDSHQLLEKKLSSHNSVSRKLAPAASVKSSISSDFSISYQYDESLNSGRVGAFAEKPKEEVLVEIQPGLSLPLRGSQETLLAVEAGRVLNTCCLSCCASLIVKDDCDFVICPACRCVSPVEGGFGTMECVGLGMRL